MKLFIQLVLSGHFDFNIKLCIIYIMRQICCNETVSSFILFRLFKVLFVLSIVNEFCVGYVFIVKLIGYVKMDVQDELNVNKRIKLHLSRSQLFCTVVKGIKKKL